MILLSTTIKSICNLYLYLSQPSHRIPHIYWDKYSRFDNGLIVHCEASTHFFTFHNMFHGHTIPCCSFPPILIFQFGTLVSLNRVVGICCSFSVHETYSDALTIAKRYKKRKIFYSIFYEKKKMKNNTWVVYSFGKDIQTLFWVQLQNTQNIANIIIII